jgi:ATP-grasp domain, R2K clade family 3
MNLNTLLIWKRNSKVLEQLVYILFPSLPINPNEIDPDYEIEYQAAQAAGFTCKLYELEALRHNDLRNALRYCPPAAVEQALLVYRGWMVSDTHYAALYNALIAKGYQPITTPEAYAEAHYLPLAYPLLQGITPQTIWMEGQDSEHAWQLYQQISHEPAIIKDYVKSAKHRWREACYIPAYTSRGDFETILQAFLRERGKLFEKGLVFRRYHELVQLGEDMRGKPIHEEYRLYCVNGKITAHAPFPDPADLEQQRGTWEQVALRFRSRFLTIDVARQADASWIVVEVGDAGVSGLPLSIDPDTFYQALWQVAFREWRWATSTE